MSESARDVRTRFALDTIAVFGLGLVVSIAAFPLWDVLADPLVRAAARAGNENIGLFLLGAFYRLLFATVATGVGYFTVVYRPKSPRHPARGAAAWARASGYAILVVTTAAVFPWLVLFIFFGLL